MILLDSVVDLSMFKTAYLIKTLINIIAIATPIVIIIKSTIDVSTSITDTKKIKNTPLLFIRRLLAGIIVLMIPSILISLITIFTNNNLKDSNFFIYYKDASKAKIEEVQNLVDKEELERENLDKAQEKENLVVKANSEQLKKYQSEEQKEEDSDDNKDDNKDDGDSKKDYDKDKDKDDTTQAGKEVLVDPKTGDGTYGRVTVKNGVFYIPNKRATSNADTPTLSGKHGLNPVFWERLNKFITDASKQGYKITVTSAIRPYSKQLQLWNNSSRSCSERSKWVACPGGSRHGWGIAADLKYNGKSCDQSNWNCNAAAKWAHENASKYLLTYRMKWEPWHIEPSQVKGGSYGKCTAKC